MIIKHPPKKAGTKPARTLSKEQAWQERSFFLRAILVGAISDLKNSISETSREQLAEHLQSQLDKSDREFERNTAPPF